MSRKAAGDRLGPAGMLGHALDDNASLEWACDGRGLGPESAVRRRGQVHVSWEVVRSTG